MASLKTLKMRIGSVKSTQKITKAMKMVAEAKLRRAQANAEAGRPYATRLSQVVASLASRVTIGPQSPKLIAGTGSDTKHLIVLATGDRGLAGAFNTNIVRAARTRLVLNAPASPRSPVATTIRWRWSLPLPAMSLGLCGPTVTRDARLATTCDSRVA